MGISRAYAQAAEPGNFFVAGKNKIINGDFAINQRGFSSSTGPDGTYGFDRWSIYLAGGTTTYSAQTFTPGTAPVAGYEAINFARMATTGQSGANDYSVLGQRIEDVRTLANQTVTVSFWAKASSGTPKVAVELQQAFGSGGSPSSAVNTYAGQVTLSTSWARYSVTVVLPSISGKTIGTTVNTSYLWLLFWTSAGSAFNSRTGSLGIQTATIDFWGVQVEAGSVATPFTTASGTIQGEIALCQRYCYRRTTGSNGYGMATITAYGANDGYARIDLPVRMRTTPTATLSGTASHYRAYINNLVNLTSIGLQEGNTDFALFSVSVTGNGLYGVGAGGFLTSDTSSNGYLQLNAEL